MDPFKGTLGFCPSTVGGSSSSSSGFALFHCSMRGQWGFRVLGFRTFVRVPSALQGGSRIWGFRLRLKVALLLHKETVQVEVRTQVLVGISPQASFAVRLKDHGT